MDTQYKLRLLMPLSTPRFTVDEVYLDQSPDSQYMLSLVSWVVR
jgi:hypothetical protein